MNGITNSVLPMNSSARVRPMNEPVTAIIIASVAVGKALHGIIQERKANKKAKGEAHSAFMHEVYKLGFSNEHNQYIHQRAERNLEDAGRYVDNVITNMIREAEEEAAKKAAKEAAKEAMSRGINPQAARDKAVQQVYDNTDDIILSDFNTKKQNWWTRQSNVTKGLIIGGGALAIGGGIYLLTRPHTKQKRR